METIRFENQLKSKNMCVIICNKLLETLEKTSETKTISAFSFFQKQVHNLKKIYADEAKGPAKFEIFTNNFLEGVLRISDRVFSKQKIEFEEYFLYKL